LDAKIVGQDKDMDLALLKIDAAGLPSLPLGDYGRLRQGQVVLAFGSPKGLENSVTMGVISSVARQANPSRPMIYIRRTPPSTPETVADRWSTWTATWSASTRLS
jgi:serine protease Do